MPDTAHGSTRAGSRCIVDDVVDMILPSWSLAGVQEELGNRVEIIPHS